MALIKGRCLACGEILRGETRAITEMQFTLHNEEKHKQRLDRCDAMVMKFFTDTLPELEKKREKIDKVLKRHDKREKKAVTPENAEWV